MRFDFRTFILGGEILDPALHARSGRAFTRVIPTRDGVLTPHHVGDLIGAWAMCMCMRDVAIAVDSTFGGFVYVDKLDAKGKAQAFSYASNLGELHWWQDRLTLLIKLEQQLMEREFVSLAVDIDVALGMLTAVEWFISRYRCRPEGVGEGLHRFETQIAAAMKDEKTEKSAKNMADLPATGIESLSRGDRASVEAMRAYEENEFRFLTELGLSPDQTKRAREEEAGDAADAKAMGIVEPVFAGLDEVDSQVFSSITVQRAVAPDGFRDEDRQALDRFRSYVGLAVEHVPPLKSRWLDGGYVETGRRIFGLGQLLFSSSFPNADSARLREEELQAARARAEREAEERERSGSMRGGVE